MHIAIVGSRRFKNRRQVEDLVRSLPAGTVVVSGGCHGPDNWAEVAAKEQRLETAIFLPKMPPDGSPDYEYTKAYYGRNFWIAKMCDELHAFVSKTRTGGTENTIKVARQLGRRIVLHQEAPEK